MCSLLPGQGFECCSLTLGVLHHAGVAAASRVDGIWGLGGSPPRCIPQLPLGAETPWEGVGGTMGGQGRCWLAAGGWGRLELRVAPSPSVAGGTWAPSTDLPPAPWERALQARLLCALPQGHRLRCGDTLTQLWRGQASTAVIKPLEASPCPGASRAPLLRGGCGPDTG